MGPAARVGFPRHRPRRDRGGVRDGVRGAGDVPDAPPAEHDGRRPLPHRPAGHRRRVPARPRAEGRRADGRGAVRPDPVRDAVRRGRADRRADGDAVGSGPTVGPGGERRGAGGRLHLAVRSGPVFAAVEGGRRPHRAGRRAVRGGRAGDPRRRLHPRRVRGPAVAGGGSGGARAERDPRGPLLETPAGEYVRPGAGERGGREPAAGERRADGRDRGDAGGRLPGGRQHPGGGDAGDALPPRPGAAPTASAACWRGPWRSRASARS